MPLHPLAGLPAPQSILANIPRLISEYYSLIPDSSVASQKVSFGTSGHRGSAATLSFNERHILAISQAVCDYRVHTGVEGPLFLGIDTHALSEPARVSAIEVFAANGVELMLDHNDGYTPTPVISHAILRHNRDRQRGLADGVVITPSHNPPEDGGYKYNAVSGGPADTVATCWIEERANALLDDIDAIQRWPWARAIAASHVRRFDYVSAYVADLDAAVDIASIRDSGIRIGVDPLGGAAVDYWGAIAERHGINLEVVNDAVDPSFRFMNVDKDGKIRMDCSSPAAMAGLVELKDRYDIAFANDADVDRHGIVTPSGGLMNPNHYLSVAIAWLFEHRPDWPVNAGIGKTLVTSSMVDRIAASIGRPLAEVPVGFKWFVDGLLDGSHGFSGEESAGASFLRRNGQVWTTDKDGIILGLLAAEICATSGRDPARHYADLTERFGAPIYERIQAPANPAQKSLLKKLSPEQVSATELAGEPIEARLTRAPANNAAFGGLKIVTENGWFAARPSGTEDIYKIYAESFKGADHLRAIQHEARDIVADALA